MSEESIKPPSKTDISFYKYGQGRVKFTGICLKQGSISFINGNIAKLYISYELDT